MVAAKGIMRPSTKLNLLDKIVADWPYFETLHGWWREMPNYNPIAVTNSGAGQDHAGRAQELFDSPDMKGSVQEPARRQTFQELDGGDSDEGAELEGLTAEFANLVSIPLKESVNSSGLCLISQRSPERKSPAPRLKSSSPSPAPQATANASMSGSLDSVSMPSDDRDFRGRDIAKIQAAKAARSTKKADPGAILASACAKEADIARRRLETTHKERMSFMQNKAAKRKLAHDEKAEERRFAENREKRAHEAELKRMELDEMKLRLQLEQARNAGFGIPGQSDVFGAPSQQRFNASPSATGTSISSPIFRQAPLSGSSLSSPVARPSSLSGGFDDGGDLRSTPGQGGLPDFNVGSSNTNLQANLDPRELNFFSLIGHNAQPSS